MKYWIFVLVMVITLSSHAVIRVTCVGASITWGAFIDDHVAHSFPGQL